MLYPVGRLVASKGDLFVAVDPRTLRGTGQTLLLQSPLAYFKTFDGLSRSLHSEAVCQGEGVCEVRVDRTRELGRRDDEGRGNFAKLE